MATNDRAGTAWRKSSRCTNTHCVEMTSADGLLRLRNSTRPDIVVSFTAAEWRDFSAAVIGGEFDDLAEGVTATL